MDNALRFEFSGMKSRGTRIVAVWLERKSEQQGAAATEASSQSESDQQATEAAAATYAHFGSSAILAQLKGVGSALLLAQTGSGLVGAVLRVRIPSLRLGPRPFGGRISVTVSHCVFLMFFPCVFETGMDLTDSWCATRARRWFSFVGRSRGGPFKNR